jgi:hypothetical protein
MTYVKYLGKLCGSALSVVTVIAADQTRLSASVAA